MRELRLSDIASVLLSRRGDFVALDVFANDVAEIAGQEAVFMPVGPDQYQADVTGTKVDVQIFRDRNIARFTLAQPNDSLAGGALGAAAGALSGALFGGAVENRQQSPTGSIFGLLIGGLLGAAVGHALTGQRVPRQILTLRYDRNEGQWKVYHGPYLGWAKEALRAE